MIDPITRLDRVEASGRTIIYHNTILSLPGLSLSEFKAQESAVREKITQGVCGTDQTRDIVEHAVTMRYIFGDESQQHLMEIDVTEADCNR